MNKINFEQTIKLIHKEINVKLVKTNKELDKFLLSAVPIIPKLGKYFFKKKGKQLRPVICLLSSKMINKNYPKISSDINMSAAIEFIHGATLLHDDVIDEGKLRRGQKSVNSIWNNKFSVLFGDFLFSKSFQLMTKANSLKAMASLSQVSSKISEGEFMQLTHENNIYITESEYIKIITLKTAELFAAAMKIPAILTSKNSKTILNLNKLGLYFGIIFQIMDDYLDYFGNRVTGKKNGKDFYEGKITLPIILLLKKAADNEIFFIKKIFRKEKRLKKDYVKIMILMKKYKINDDLKKFCNKYNKKSQKLLTKFKGYQKELFLNLLTNSINRSY